MAIYDCFQYFNEDHILDMRFNILDKYVDYFVVSESTKTHQGKEKNLILISIIFQSLKEKLNTLLQVMMERNHLTTTNGENQLLSSIKEIVFQRVSKSIRR